MRQLKFKPIGFVHSPFHKREEIDPARNVRPGGFSKVEGSLEIDERYTAGLRDISGFSHLIVIFVFHQSSIAKLRVKPPFERRTRGVFSTRSPHRPNPIGMTVVRLLGRKRNILKVSGLDMLDGTPILDIKPYTAKERKRGVRRGWMHKNIKNTNRKEA